MSVDRSQMLFDMVSNIEDHIYWFFRNITVQEVGFDEFNELHQSAMDFLKRAYKVTKEVDYAR